MKPIQEYEKDIASIRTMMERSVKFISLSGLSGVLAGIYALAGSVAAYHVLHFPASPFEYQTYSLHDENTALRLIAIALVILTASITTVLWLSQRKAKKHGIRLWSPASRSMLINVAIPLVSGGIFILVMMFTGHIGLVAPACLIFYGIALIQGSSNTYDEVRYLGFCQIALGLVAAMFPGYGLIIWAFGFGVLHIVYGAILYNKYDR